MFRKISINWTFFLIILTGTNIYAIVEILDSESALYAFYMALMPFHFKYTLLYSLAIADRILNLFLVIPAALWLFRAPSRMSWAWMLLLGFKVFLDLLGHHYEWQIFKANLHGGQWELFIPLSFFILLNILHYWLLIKYISLQCRTPAKKLA